MATQTETEKRYIREHGLFTHPRTCELISFVSESAIAYRTVHKNKDKSAPITEMNNVKFTFMKTEKLNATLPQVAYNRLVNATCLTPVHIVKGVTFNIWNAPNQYEYVCPNHKKHYFCERKHGYASLSAIKRAQDPRYIPPIKERERKVRITKSGKLKLRRF